MTTTLKKISAYGYAQARVALKEAQKSRNRANEIACMWPWLRKLRGLDSAFWFHAASIAERQAKTWTQLADEVHRMESENKVSS